MIAYNTTQLFNAGLLKKAKHWYAQQLLTAEQYALVTERYKVDLYTPNLFIKIGLFIFTWVAILAALALFGMLFFQGFDTDAAISVTCLLFAAGCIAVLENFIKDRKLYRSGIDEALLYAAILFIAGMFGNLFSWFTDTTFNMLFYTLLIMPVLAAAVVRYGDALVAFVLAMCCYVVCFLLLLKLGAVAKLIMPFAMMLLSAALYVAAHQLKQKRHLHYWHTAIVVVECVGLLFFYASVNYFVIREASIAFFDMHLNKGQDIPLAIVFYLLTAAIPVAYVFYGLKRRERSLLWIGFVTVALSAITFRHYFGIAPAEVVLIIAGISLTGIAYAAIRYLKTPKHRLTFAEAEDENSFLITNVEAIIQSKTFGHTSPAATAANTVEFGGGSSGGGGATGRW